jgi:uncharacterized phage-associated protein
LAKVIDVANYFSEASGGKLSNLALQKYVYLAHMYFAGKNCGGRLVEDDAFQAWDYGPVSPKLYRRVSGFGSSPIPRVMFHGAASLRQDEMDSVREVWEALKDASPGRLVQITHDPRGAWKRTYRPGKRGMEISQQEIVDEYNRRSAGQ